MVPLCPDWIDEVDGEDESAETEKDPQNSLRPMTTVFSDVAQTMKRTEENIQKD